MRRVILFLVLCLPAWPSSARTGDADVREGPRGGPCFTIDAREERLGIPDFQSVAVSDGPRVLWKMAMPRERTFPLRVGTCVPYGGRVAALPRSEAAVLEEGKVYHVRIEARPGGKKVAAGYEARFCLARGRDGGVAVEKIDKDGRCKSR